MIEEQTGVGCVTKLVMLVVGLAVFALLAVFVMSYGYAAGGGAPPRVASDDVSATASGGSSIAIIHGDNNRVNQESSYTAVPTPTPAPTSLAYKAGTGVMMVAMGCLFPLAIFLFVGAAIASSWRSE